jgi:hypothetical protein
MYGVIFIRQFCGHLSTNDSLISVYLIRRRQHSILETKYSPDVLLNLSIAAVGRRGSCMVRPCYTLFKNVYFVANVYHM